MRRLLTALAVAALVAVPVAGCGDKAPGIPKADAAELIRLLKKAQAASDDPQGRCDQLLATVAKLEQRVAALPSNIDKDVRDSVANGARNLQAQSASLCSQNKTPTTTTTTPTTTIPTTPPPSTQTLPPQTTPTTPPQTTPTTPPQTVPPQTTPGTGGTGPGNGNGNGNGGGNGNGNGRGTGGGIGPGGN